MLQSIHRFNQLKSFLALLLFFAISSVQAQTIQYTVIFPEAGLHRMHVELEAKNWNGEIATLFQNFEKNINTIENGTGKKYQSLAQASYDTWSDGPFGKQSAEAGKSISYYEKGLIVGLLFDFAIRHSTANQKSLDDVMRYLYFHYYKELHRGFTDAEFQQACESIAGISMTDLFEYVYTTKELDYKKYLGYGGLELVSNGSDKNGTKRFQLKRLENPNKEQAIILQAWLNKNHD